MVPDVAKQATIARARALRAEGRTIAAVVDALEAEGHGPCGPPVRMAALHKLVA